MCEIVLGVVGRENIVFPHLQDSYSERDVCPYYDDKMSLDSFLAPWVIRDPVYVHLYLLVNSLGFTDVKKKNYKKFNIYRTPDFLNLAIYFLVENYTHKQKKVYCQGETVKGVCVHMTCLCFQLWCWVSGIVT